MKNNRTAGETELLADLFHENWDADKVAGYAQTAAARIRRRRLVKRSLAATALTALLATFLWPPIRERSFPRERATTSSFTVQRDYEVITTDQLLSQLRDRPFLVVQEGGPNQKVILLDQN